MAINTHARKGKSQSCHFTELAGVVEQGEALICASNAADVKKAQKKARDQSFDCSTGA
jgi:hypothetical protein